MTSAPPSLPDFLTAIGATAYEWDMETDQLIWYGSTESVFGPGGRLPAKSRDFYELIYSEDRPAVFGNEETKLDRQYRIKLPTGAQVWVHERGMVEMTGGKAARQRGILRVIERPSERPGRIDSNGRDLLTGCFDRGYMVAQIDKAMDAAKASRRMAAYLVVSIDKMSFVNEAVGMEAGDALLRGVAERLGQIMPHRAVLARVGGDTFGMLLPEPLGADMQGIAERVLKNFRDQPVTTPSAPLHITVSIGGVRLPALAKTAGEGMLFAEQALHDAQQHGRNMFAEYFESTERATVHRKLLELSERINHAFKNDGFRLAFQPVVDSRSGETMFYEALVRMFDPDGKPVSAAEFVPAIEQLGLAFELDRAVLDLAVKELKAAPDLCLAVNISGLTAAHADWPEHVQRVLGPYPEVAQRIIIEITETAAIVDVSETRRFIDSIRELGGLVSLDDFGAGFTSIRHLRSLGLSIMKIDKELLQNVLINAEQQHMVLVLIELAHGLSLKVVAEGVETADVADWLRRARVDMLQGYYFGKPSLDKPWQIARKAESGGSGDAIPFGHPAGKSLLPTIGKITAATV